MHDHSGGHDHFLHGFSRQVHRHCHDHHHDDDHDSDPYHDHEPYHNYDPCHDHGPHNDHDHDHDHDHDWDWDSTSESSTDSYSDTSSDDEDSLLIAVAQYLFVSPDCRFWAWLIVASFEDHNGHLLFQKEVFLSQWDRRFNQEELAEHLPRPTGKPAISQARALITLPRIPALRRLRTCVVQQRH